MENSNISTPARKEKLEPKKPEFKKNDFTITMESMGDGFEMFIQKSADALFDLGKNIKNFFASLKKKRLRLKQVNLQKFEERPQLNDNTSYRRKFIKSIRIWRNN